MYLDQERATTDESGKILCLYSSNEGKEMGLLLKIAEIIKSGKKEIFIIREEPGRTALNESGLFSLTIGFR